MQPRPLPTFIIAGAQRSGTTFLYNLCDDHPDIYMAKPCFPEPKFFHVDEEFDKGGDYYSERYFTDASSSLIVGEKSANYLEHSHVARRKQGLLGAVKLVFALRNPIDRAYSNYLYSRNHGLESQTFDEAIRTETAREAAYCGRMRSVRPFSYMSRGLYARHLKSYLQALGSSAVHVLLFDDLIRDPVTVSASLYEFLGARPHDPPAHLNVKTNSTQGVTDADGSAVVSRGTYAHLRETYRPENAALAEQIQRDIRCWDRPYDDYRDRLETESRGR